MKHDLIVTVGPKTSRADSLIKLRNAGANIFRINLSHSNHEELEDYISEFRNANIKYTLDTQGAQLRTGSNLIEHMLEENEKTIIVFGEDNYTSINEKVIRFNHPEAFSQIEVKDAIRIGFEGITLEVEELDRVTGRVTCNVLTGGKLAKNKAVDIVNKTLDLKAFTKFDKEAIEKCANDELLGGVFVSFANSEDDIICLRDIIKSSSSGNAANLKLIAKIETNKALRNIEQIMKEADGILIDRGDLSREISISRVPLATQAVIEIAKRSKKTCYIATNVLDSMMTEPLPSRAEISDLYNLLQQGVSGIVLAAEVAIGNNPIDSVHVVKYMYEMYIAHSNQLLGVSWKIINTDRLPETLRKWL